MKNEYYNKYRQYEHDRLQHGWKIDDVYKIVYELEEDHPTSIEQRTFKYVADNLKTLDKSKIISLCNEYKGVDNWAAVVISVNDYIRALGENGGLKEYEWQWLNTHGSVILNAEITAKAILSIFNYYHSDLEPDFYLQTLVADTLNDERADNRATGGVQAAEPQPTPTPAALNLPDELATERAKKYFGRAVEKGYMTVADKGATWNKSQVELAFVCYLIYENSHPINTLELYFGKRSLAASIAQAANAYDLYKSKNGTQTLKVKTWIKTVLQDIFFE